MTSNYHYPLRHYQQGVPPQSTSTKAFTKKHEKKRAKAVAVTNGRVFLQQSVFHIHHHEQGKEQWDSAIAKPALPQPSSSIVKMVTPIHLVFGPDRTAKGTTIRQVMMGKNEYASNTNFRNEFVRFHQSQQPQPPQAETSDCCGGHILKSLPTCTIAPQASCLITAPSMEVVTNTAPTTCRQESHNGRAGSNAKVFSRRTLGGQSIVFKRQRQRQRQRSQGFCCSLPPSLLTTLCLFLWWTNVCMPGSAVQIGKDHYYALEDSYWFLSEHHVVHHDHIHNNDTHHDGNNKNHSNNNDNKNNNFWETEFVDANFWVEDDTTAATMRPAPSTDRRLQGPTADAPTGRPSTTPSIKPTAAPTGRPSVGPTKQPTATPTIKPTSGPTRQPTGTPTKRPTSAPSVQPTFAPTKRPTAAPSIKPSVAPTQKPTSTIAVEAKGTLAYALSILADQREPTRAEVDALIPQTNAFYLDTLKVLYPNLLIFTIIGFSSTYDATNIYEVSADFIAYAFFGDGQSVPTQDELLLAMDVLDYGSYVTNYVRVSDPLGQSIFAETTTVDFRSGTAPTPAPTGQPTRAPTEKPTVSPTKQPTLAPSSKPTFNPTRRPTSSTPTMKPTSTPTQKPTAVPTKKPTASPTKQPTIAPARPTLNPTRRPTSAPTSRPSLGPTKMPTGSPTIKPTAIPTKKPTAIPTLNPTRRPTASPTKKPTSIPTKKPTATPTRGPTGSPTKQPTVAPGKPTLSPTSKPTLAPTEKPTLAPTKRPTAIPTKKPTAIPTLNPTLRPTASPSKKPTAIPTKKPTATPTRRPTSSPTNQPTVASGKPTLNPTEKPTLAPTEKPTLAPTKKPTAIPTKKPTAIPTLNPTKKPTSAPTQQPTVAPGKPTLNPTEKPTLAPTEKPTLAPTKRPTAIPTKKPTAIPTLNPTLRPTASPTKKPTSTPSSTKPTSAPTRKPTTSPTKQPTLAPGKPTLIPTRRPTSAPTIKPTVGPTKVPQASPTIKPTSSPTKQPTVAPGKPTLNPTKRPTSTPVQTKQPTASPMAEVLINGTLRYAFFINSNAREPTEAELGALMKQTDAFYLATLQAAFPDSEVSFEILEFFWTFDSSRTFQVFIDFDAKGIFRGGASSPTEIEVFAAMEAANYDDYMNSYVSQSEPVGQNIFVETSAVEFMARAMPASMPSTSPSALLPTSMSPTSEPTPRPTPRPSSDTTAPPTPGQTIGKNVPTTGVPSTLVPTPLFSNLFRSPAPSPNLRPSTTPTTAPTISRPPTGAPTASLPTTSNPTQSSRSGCVSSDESTGLFTTTACSPTIRPTNGPILVLPVVPTLSPTTKDTQTVTVYNAWDVSNSKGLTADMLISGPDRDGLNEAYVAFLTEMVSQMPGNRRLLPSTRRKLVVLFNPKTAKVYKIVNTACPGSLAARQTCQTAYGRFDLYVAKEDVSSVYHTYVKATQAAIENGRLQQKLEKVDPASAFRIEGISEPDPGVAILPKSSPNSITKGANSNEGLGTLGIALISAFCASAVFLAIIAFSTRATRREREVSIEEDPLLEENAKPLSSTESIYSHSDRMELGKIGSGTDGNEALWPLDKSNSDGSDKNLTQDDVCSLEGAREASSVDSFSSDDEDWDAENKYENERLDPPLLENGLEGRDEQGGSGFEHSVRKSTSSELTEIRANTISASCGSDDDDSSWSSVEANAVNDVALGALHDNEQDDEFEEDELSSQNDNQNGTLSMEPREVDFGSSPFLDTNKSISEELEMQSQFEDGCGEIDVASGILDDFSSAAEEDAVPESVLPVSDDEQLEAA